MQDKMKMLAAICLMGMCLMTCADVFLRATFNHPIFGTEEIVSICAILAIAFSLPYSHKKDVHIGVEILVRLLSKRAQSIIKVVTQTFSFIIMVIITWRMFLYAGTMANSGELSMNLQLPMYYFVYILFVCFLVFSVMILKDIIQFFTGVEEEL
ncbi:TRAP transporter small permease [Desulfamplus magnetovallimortis]|nr:TRAP transporter small permease [Desulfamplus magnetovallimortis]